MDREIYGIQGLKESIVFGWRPVHAAFGEDDQGRSLNVVDIDMICEWRLGDGKIKFIRVPFDTSEQLNVIKTALQGSTKVFAKVLMDKFVNLGGQVDHA